MTPYGETPRRAVTELSLMSYPECQCPCRTMKTTKRKTTITQSATTAIAHQLFVVPGDHSGGEPSDGRFVHVGCVVTPSRPNIGKQVERDCGRQARCRTDVDTVFDTVRIVTRTRAAGGGGPWMPGRSGLRFGGRCPESEVQGRWGDRGGCSLGQRPGRSHPSL